MTQKKSYGQMLQNLRPQTICNSLMKDIIGNTMKAVSKDSLQQFLL